MSGPSSPPRTRSDGSPRDAGAGAPGELARERSAIFTGDLRRYRDLLQVSAGGGGGIPASDLLRPGVLDEVLAPILARHRDADRRAVISLWSQWYFARLIVPATVLALRAHRILPLALDRVEVVHGDEDGLPVEFLLPDAGSVRPGADAFQRFRPLVRGHLEPLVPALSRYAGLARGLLWSNAASYLDWILSVLESDEGETGAVEAVGHAAEEPASAILDARRWPDGWRNRLGRGLRVVETGDGRVRRRRVCCIRYLIPGVEGCGEVCPLDRD